MPKPTGVGGTADNTSGNSAGNTSVNTIDITSATELLNLIEKKMKDWDNYEFRDDNLWEAYFDYFEGYTEDDFNLVDKDKFREFRSYLRKRGVWVQIGPRISCSTALANTLKEDKPGDWTEDELKRCFREGFISLELLDRIKRIKKNDPTYQENAIAAATAASSSRPPSRQGKEYSPYQKVSSISYPPIKTTFSPSQFYQQQPPDPAPAPATGAPAATNPALPPPPNPQMPPQLQQPAAYNPFSPQPIGPAASPQQWQPMPTGPTYPPTGPTYQPMPGPTYPAYTGAPYTYPPSPPPPPAPPTLTLASP